MRPRVLVPLLLALAAALGLVVGAVLPGGTPTPTADGVTSSPSATGEPTASEDSSVQPTDGASSPAAIGDVIGDGGGVSAVNMPQPEWPVTKLAPGDKPPQFVTISFDGSWVKK